MDIARMAAVIQEKHGVTLDQDGSVFLLATVAAEPNRESREEFARMPESWLN